MGSVAEMELPKCFTVQEVAKSLNLHDTTVRKMFQDLPGVIKLTKGKRRLRGKREYVTLRIPEGTLRDFLAGASR